MPDTWIIAACPLCGERRYYLPTEAGAVGTERSLMGEMRRAIDHEIREQRKRDRFAHTLVIAAAIIAAVRLARDDISRPTPRLNSVVNESVSLARSILDRIVP